MKLQVAIIGSPGSGKTVLTAVLARYLSHHSKSSVFMNPKGAIKHTGKEVETVSTLSYVSGVVETLRNGKWPPGTPPDQRIEMGFELRIGKNVYDMKLLDSGGEDLQAIGLNYDSEQLSPFRKILSDYISSSNVVILIVNLDHFADAPTLTQKDENENVLKEAVDNLVKEGVCHHVLVCLACPSFSDSDSYYNSRIAEGAKDVKREANKRFG